jgi:secernin
MFDILRNKESGIIMDSHLITTGSHVSVLSSDGLPDCHWMTGTPDPSLSVFKPFIFSEHVDIGDITYSSSDNNRHLLYKYHEKARDLMSGGSKKGMALVQLMRNLEENCVLEMDEFCQKFSPEYMSDVEELFKDICESEVKFYL